MPRYVEKPVTICLTQNAEDWVELVHSVATKMELVEHLSLSDNPRKNWLRCLRGLYKRLQSAVEAEGIEC